MAPLERPYRMQILRIDREPDELDISPAYRLRPRKFLLAVAKQGDRCVWSASLEVKYPGSRTVCRTNWASVGWRRIRWYERYCIKGRHGHVKWICQALIKAWNAEGMCSAICRFGCDEPVKDFRKHSTRPEKACLLQSSGCKRIAVLGSWTILVTGGVNAGTESSHLIPLRTEIIITGNHRMWLV